MPSGAYGYTGGTVSSLPVLDAGASAWQHEPYVKILHDDLIKGWLPLWNPYVGNGAPFLANMFSAVLSPLRLLIAAVETPVFWDLYLLFRLFLAAFFTFLFARRIEIGFVGAMVAGISFGLSGQFILGINMPDLDVQILLPALLLVADELLQNPSYGRFTLTALLVALIILGGMPESALFVFLLTGLYFLVRGWPSGQVDSTRWVAFVKPVLSFAGAGIVGLLIALPLVLPFLEYLQHAFNPRAPGVGSLHLDINTAVSIIMPGFFGHLHQTWTGVSSFLILPYVGATCFLLALAAVCQQEPRARVTILFSSFAVFYLLKAFGIAPVQWVSRLPLFSMSLFPKHAFPEFAFCLALLAGTGAEGLLRKKLNYLRFALASALLSLTVAVFAAYHWKAAVHAGGLQNVTQGCRTFAVYLALVWILAWTARRFGTPRLVALGLIFLPTAELAGFIPRDRTDRYDAFTKPPFVDFLRTDPELYRTFSADRFLYPDTSAAYGIDDIRSLDPIQVQRYIEFLRKDVSSKVYDRFDGTEPDKGFLGSPLLDLMNVKYVLASSEIRGSVFIADLLRNSFVLPADRPGVDENTFLIDGVRRSVLAQHPPSRIDYETVLRHQSHLDFEMAMDPAAWSLADGVTFRVDVTSLSEAQKLFSEYIDPKDRASNRRWRERSIDLSRYRGQEIYLIFQTLPGADTTSDVAHWAQLPGGISDSLRSKLSESQIIASAPNYVRPSELTIGGRKLETWEQRAPATVRFRLRIPNEQPKLNFAMGADLAEWKPGKEGGVGFEIFAAPVQSLFSRAIDPKNNRKDRKWQPADIDLSKFQNQRILLSFQTLPEANNTFDSAGWGDLRLEGEHEKFDLVYNHEVKIYKNSDVLPRAFVVRQSEVIAGKDGILARLMQSSFDPRKAVILEEGVPVQLAPTIPEDGDASSPVVFDRYEPNYIRLQATLARPGWLVLTDTYYPGWKVRVDGHIRRILPADYIFRAVSLEPGSHVVEFIYRPLSFLLGVAISILTLVGLLVYALVRKVNGRRRSRAEGWVAPVEERVLN